MDAVGNSLREGEEYTVSSVYLHLIRIQGIRAGLYSGSRFEKVAEPAPTEKERGEHIRATDGLKLDLVKAHDEIDALQAVIAKQNKLIGDLQKELDFYYARLIEKLRTCAPA